MTLLKRARSAAKVFLDPSCLQKAVPPPPPPPPKPSLPPPFPRSEAEPSPLVEQVISKFDRICGFFNEDDCMHFYLILKMQSLLGIQGDIFEIGSYFGRSTTLLAHCLQPGERLVVCDAFETKIDDHYSSTPSVDDLIQNLLLVTPEFNLDQLEVHNCLSTDLKLPEQRRFRFAHVDGGHDAETAYGDLCLTASRVLPRGIIAIDDYKHPDWPGVTEAVDRFLTERGTDFLVLADMNRHMAKGRKLYLTLNADKA